MEIFLHSIVFSLNDAINETTGLSPFYLCHGTHPLLPYENGLDMEGLPPTYLLDLQAARIAAQYSILGKQETHRAKYNKHHFPLNLILGDFVMLTT